MTSDLPLLEGERCKESPPARQCKDPSASQSWEDAKAHSSLIRKWEVILSNL